MAMCYKNMFVVLNFLTFNLLANSLTENDGITIDLFHRDSHLSPSYNPSIAHFERLRASFNRSFSRKSSLWSKSTSIEAPLTSVGGEYLMNIRIGTPPVDILAIADTGSDLTWTQCKPCNNCFKQKAPFFDPKQSKTYKRVSCGSKICNYAVNLGSCGKNTTNVCRYRSSYGDNSYSLGDLSRETFTFGSSAAYPKVVFGCGHQNGGTFDVSATGIVGLGWGSLSLVNQLKRFVQPKFSYCLTSFNSNISSKISFGAKALVQGPKAASTPLIQKMPDTFYYLTLKGISVGIKKLQYLEYDNTKASGFDNGNMIIDSGTTLTFLPIDLYEKLESALDGVMKGKRTLDSQGIFKMCYEMPENGVFDPPPPRIVVHFAGADLELPKGTVFVEVERGVVCLTLLPTENVVIFGNLHQANYHVGYDLVNNKVSFEPMDCSKFK